METKKTIFTKRPDSIKTELDNWISKDNNFVADENLDSEDKLKAFNVKIPAQLHKLLKFYCLKNNKTIQQLIIQMIEKELD